MKHRFVYSFANQAGYHWYSDLQTGHYSFQQFNFSGDESVQFGSVVQEYVPGTKREKFPFLKRIFYDFIAHSCGVTSWRAKPTPRADAAKQSNSSGKSVPGDLRVTDPCDFGRFDVKSYLVLSHAAQGNAIPFYMQPTLGGSDISSLVTLRGYSDYRFRAPDATFVQTEYGIPVWQPLGALIFYDAGAVGETVSQLSFSNFRQDAGAGVTLSFGGSVVAQGYLAGGFGNGVRFGYNFTKFF